MEILNVWMKREKRIFEVWVFKMLNWWNKVSKENWEGIVIVVGKLIVVF